MLRYLRHLRIAFAATCLIACGLLIVLWVKSYWLLDGVWIRYSQTPSRSVRLFTERGRLVVQPLKDSPTLSFFYEHHKVEDASAGRPDDDGRDPGGWWFQVLHWSGDPLYFIPMWFPTLIVGAAAALCIPWSRRFSFRTLLIATTLLAVLLGLVASLRR